VCGRFTSTASADDLARAFDVDGVRTDPLPVRYNVAPTQPVYAVALRRGRRTLGHFRWGLVPRWATDTTVGGHFINARAETVASKAAFKDALAHRRCLIPADGFYEWQQRADGGNAGKLPYLFTAADGRPMAFAGLWEVWRDPKDRGARTLQTCVIITSPANDVVAPVHGRMPVILAPEDWEIWLNPTSEAGTVMDLLTRPPASRLTAYPVSSLVNSVANDGPQLAEPMAIPARLSRPSTSNAGGRGVQ
jgi:putative SOS response-associated peptidase YedK